MKKFTLIELLLVIAVLGILLTLLLPSLNSAREKGKFVVCASQRSQNLRLIMLGLKDNKGKLPLFFYWGPRNVGGDWSRNNQIQPDYELDDWMGTIGRGGVSPWKRGKQYSIVNPVAGLYAGDGFNEIIYQHNNVKELHPISSILRCPSLEEKGFNTGIGSNGAFDYSFPQALRGFNLSQIDTSAVWNGKAMPTPLVIEEDSNKSINNGWIETSWANEDTVGTWHDFGKKGSYTSIDGANVIVRSGRPMSAADNPVIYLKGAEKSIINSSSTGATGISNHWMEEGNRWAPKITRW